MERQQGFAAFLERTQPFVRDAGASLTKDSRLLEDRNGGITAMDAILEQCRVTC